MMSVSRSAAGVSFADQTQRDDGEQKVEDDEFDVAGK